MVKIAIAGGSGQVSQEIIDALLVSERHDITILSRRAVSATPTITATSRIQWKVVNYDDGNSLAEALQGVHTLLSFVQVLSDPDQRSQKNLINAAISAGVKRFAPSEYGSKGTVNMPWWQGKERVREYLEEVNKEKTVLEYTLFQPGLFLNYLAYPHKTSKYVDPLQTIFDFENKRAIIVSGHEDAIITLTTVADVAAIVAQAIDYEGVWPKTGGIRGNRLKVSEILDIGRKVRGVSFYTERLLIKDLEAGKLETSWGLEAVHQAVSEDQAQSLLKAVSIGILLSSTKDAWDVTDDWNNIFPAYRFTSATDFLADVWQDQS